MTVALIAAEAALILFLLAALLYGMPASAEANRLTIVAQTTEVAALRATVATIPTATPGKRVCAVYPTVC